MCTGELEKGLFHLQSSVPGKRRLGPIWKELSEELFVSCFHTEEGLGFYTISLTQNKNQIGKESYYTQILQDYNCPMEGDLPERVFSSWHARAEQPRQNYLGAWKMEQILGGLKQWHQQMPSLRKEGESGDEGSDLGTTQEIKDA